MRERTSLNAKCLRAVCRLQRTGAGGGRAAFRRRRAGHTSRHAGSAAAGSPASRSARTRRATLAAEAVRRRGTKPLRATTASPLSAHPWRSAQGEHFDFKLKSQKHITTLL